MRKSVALLLVLAFLTSTCIAVKPALCFADATENTWMSKAPMKVARYGLGVAVVNGKIYAIGGQVLSYQDELRTESEDVDTNEEYDPATDTWTMKSPMPTPRNSFAIAVYQNKIYCIGSGVNEEYDPATDSWENRTPMPTARYGVQANVVDGEIYLIGGYDPTNSSVRLTINEVYDPATDSWTTKAPMPNITYGCISAVVDNEIYFISRLSRVQIYDAETDTWRLVTPPPSETYWGSAVATTGVMAPKRVYVLGISGYVPEHFVRVYNVKNDTWNFGANIPTMRSDFGVAVVNDLLYVVGGYTLVYPEKVEAPYVPTLVEHVANEQYTPFGYGTPDPSYVPPSPSPTPSQESTTPEPFPTIPVAVASVVAIAVVVGVGLLIYFRKRKH